MQVWASPTGVARIGLGHHRKSGLPSVNAVAKHTDGREGAHQDRKKTGKREQSGNLDLLSFGPFLVRFGSKIDLNWPDWASKGSIWPVAPS